MTSPSTSIDTATPSPPQRPARASRQGFLGANGAGKSTTIGCLTTLLRADAGSMQVAGHDVRTHAEAVRAAIGVVFQQSLLDDGLTVRENLRLRATLSRVPRGRFASRLAELSALIELDEVLDRPYGRLSGGQRRRADIARALLHEPATLFLDEPRKHLRGTRVSSQSTGYALAA